MRIRQMLCVGAMLACVASPAMAQSGFVDTQDDIRRAVKCAEGEGIAFILDFDRTTGGAPLTFSGFVARSQSCIKGDTQYTLQGFIGSYRSPRDIRRAIEAFRTMLSLGIWHEKADLASGFAYVRELDAPKRETAKK